jgi:hypothetical protein
MLKKIGSRLVSVAPAAAAASLVAAPAFATGDPVADLFTAFNISSLQTDIATLFTAGVGITVIFVGYRFLKKGASKL